MKSRHYLVSGRVQGVGYRNYIFKKASALGLSGRVRNLDDGRVEILAHGTENLLAELEASIAKGPMLANVTDVQKQTVPDGAAAISEGAAGSGFTVTEDGAKPWSFGG